MEIQQTGKLHLLWIAIDRYRHKFWPALSNAVSGSEALERALHDKFGLTSTRTIALENRQATLAEIEKCLRSFGPGGANELSDDDQLIISFAGHGERDQLTGETAFIPFEADPDSTSTWFRFDHLRPLLRVINARHILVISDSCFSGGVFRSATTDERTNKDAAYARRAYIKNSRQMISSGGVEKISDGGARPGKSVFLEGLLHGLRTTENRWILADKLFRETRNYVVANADQTPEFGSLQGSGHGGGEFVFFDQRPKPEAANKPVEPKSVMDSAMPEAQHFMAEIGRGDPGKKLRIREAVTLVLAIVCVALIGYYGGLFGSSGSDVSVARSPTSGHKECSGISRSSHPQGLDFPAFNCYVDNGWLAQNYGGDSREQNFVRIRKNDGDWKNDITNIDAGDTIVVAVYMANSGKDEIVETSAESVELYIDWSVDGKVFAEIWGQNLGADRADTYVDDDVALSFARSGLSLVPIEGFRGTGTGKTNLVPKIEFELSSTHWIQNWSTPYRAGYMFSNMYFVEFEVR